MNKKHIGEAISIIFSKKKTLIRQTLLLSNASSPIRLSKNEEEKTQQDRNGKPHEDQLRRIGTPARPGKSVNHVVYIGACRVCFGEKTENTVGIIGACKGPFPDKRRDRNVRSALYPTGARPLGEGILLAAIFPSAHEAH